MERIHLKKNNSHDSNEAEHPHFIGSWDIKNESACKDIINFFEENTSLQNKGNTGGGENSNIKKTTDITVYPNDLKNKKFKCFVAYIAELHKCFIDYQTQWPFLKEIINGVDVGSFNVQKYSKGDHYSKIHTERSGLHSLHRVFAWMTYLNNVEDGGTTIFSHYNMKIKPEICKALIWPAEWTHAHSGEILNSGVKYIITGWMHFPRIIQNKVKTYSSST